MIFFKLITDISYIKNIISQFDGQLNTIIAIIGCYENKSATFSSILVKVNSNSTNGND